MSHVAGSFVFSSLWDPPQERLSLYSEWIGKNDSFPLGFSRFFKGGQVDERGNCRVGVKTRATSLRKRDIRPLQPGGLGSLPSASPH